MGSAEKIDCSISLKRGQGKIVTKTDSIYLYYDIKHRGKRVEFSTRLTDTPENRAAAVLKLLTFHSEKNSKTFRFVNFFPDASPGMQAYFAALEEPVVAAKPENVKFSEYIPIWYEDVWKIFRSESKKTDQEQNIRHWIIPFFGNKSFSEIDFHVVGDFIRSLKQKKYTTMKDGKKKANKNQGKPLCRESVQHILIPLQSIWKKGCDKYRLKVSSDPFRMVKDQLPKKKKPSDKVVTDDQGKITGMAVGDRVALRFDAFMSYLDHIDMWYQPVAELWVLTGMSPSEMAGITSDHIIDDLLYVRSSISRGVEKPGGKNINRPREIKITASIRRVLDVFQARGGAEGHLVTLKGGNPLTPAAFWNAWAAAEKDALLPKRVPYVLRHTFAAWALVIGVEKDILVELMGHGSEEMVEKVYGEHGEGLEEDREKILEYFGKDFMAGITGDG